MIIWSTYKIAKRQILPFYIQLKDETNVWFYSIEQPISYHEWNWHQFQRSKSKKKQIRLAWLFTKWELETQPHVCILLLCQKTLGLQNFSSWFQLWADNEYLEIVLYFQAYLPWSHIQFLYYCLVFKKFPLLCLHTKEGDAMTWALELDRHPIILFNIHSLFILIIVNFLRVDNAFFQYFAFMTCNWRALPGSLLNSQLYNHKIDLGIVKMLALIL